MPLPHILLHQAFLPLLGEIADSNTHLGEDILKNGRVAHFEWLVMGRRDSESSSDDADVLLESDVEWIVSMMQLRLNYLCT